MNPAWKKLTLRLARRRGYICIDGLKSFSEAINTSFSKAEIQTCVVHQIRNSLKYVAMPANL